MAEATSSSELPSSALCDRVAVLTEEGLELESRVLAFAAEACELVRDFDGEVGPHLDARRSTVPRSCAAWACCTHWWSA